MPNIQLRLASRLFVPKFYPLLFDYQHRHQVFMGSAGSGKSYFIAEKIIVRCCKEPIKVLVCRRYGSTLRNSCFSLFKEVLEKWKLTPYVRIRETDFNIKFPNGSEIIHLGLDDEQKLLSINNISTVWIEEAFEITREVAEQLDLRMRGSAANQQIIYSFNPISRSSWLYDFCVNNPPESFVFHHSTYKDNPFLPAEYVKSLDEMETRNPNKYRVYGRGEWGVDSEGLVITNWLTQEFDPMELASSGLEHRAGMDLGWIDPSAIVDSLYDRENGVIYVFNEFYKSGCQLQELSDAIGAMNLKRIKLFVDSAEPRAITYFKQQGINATACSKGPNSVRTGLMFLQDHKIIVHPKCKNLIDNLENFSYIKSKQTGEWTEDTTHEWSHAIDALRYAYSDIYTQTKMKTLNKSALGL